MSSLNQPAHLYRSGAPAPVQRAAFTNGDVPVAVYGLGKMGLPLAAVYASVTGNVTGADVDPDVVDRVNAGDCHVQREPGLDDLVADLVADGSLRAVNDPVDAAADASVHVVIVPTLIDDDHHPDLSVVESVLVDVASGLDAGDLVVVESTVPPGTCADVAAPLLSAESGLDRDEFGVAFCPERTSSGRALDDIRGTHPKVVGGVDDESTRAAGLVYGEITSNDVLAVSDATTAECVKVFEGLYRDVNIALANELARFTDELGIDVREAIDVANTQPYCDIHTPGPGVGGHCIPYYPYFVLNWLTTDAPLLRTARAVNDATPGFVAETTLRRLAERGVNAADATVLVLGLTYRAGVAETRASPARGVCTALGEAGATVYATDPLVTAEREGIDATDVALDDISEVGADAVVLVTDHEEYDTLDWGAFPDPLCVVDTRDALGDALEGTDHDHYTVGSGAH